VSRESYGTGPGPFSILTRVLTWLVSVALGAVVAGLALIYFQPGWDLYVVRSDSMVPTFSSHDVIITQPVDQVRVGDIVTFHRGSQIVTHRVVEISPESIITKGDANQTADPQPVLFTDIAGGYLFRVPYAGYVTAFIATTRGWFLAIVLPAAILVLLIVREIVREALKEDESSGEAHRYYG
jgi:signal peptidase